MYTPMVFFKAIRRSIHVSAYDNYIRTSIQRGALLDERVFDFKILKCMRDLFRNFYSLVIVTHDWEFNTLLKTL